MMKKNLISIFAAAVIFLLHGGALVRGQEWRPAELQKMEDDFQDLQAQVVTLDVYAPEKFSHFPDLEKINQLVELQDFNKRKFDLLIKQYNLLEDKIFPFIIDYYDKHPELKRQLYAMAVEYAGTREANILRLQEEINRVALQVERLGKDIERFQTTIREREIAGENKQKDGALGFTLPLSTRLAKLEADLESYDIKLKEVEEKAAGLKRKLRDQAAKIAEKKMEISKLQQQAAASADEVKAFIHKTFARVREIRLNGLEIPRLNIIKTAIYISNSSIDALNNKIRNAASDFDLLKEQRRKDLIYKFVKGVGIIAIAFVVVLILSGIARRITNKIVDRVVESDKLDPHRKQRFQTLSSVSLSFIKVSLWVMAVLWVLGQLNIDYGPFLVAAGGISLAIGFGAQSLVKDVVSGFFMLMEEQFALGDVVEINGQAGSIEEISLRTIKFRSLNGTLHIIPCGSISMVSNMMYKWSQAVAEVGVSYDQDPRKVLEVLRGVCREMMEDAEWKDSMVDDPVAQGILSFGESSLNFRILAKTVAGKQWAVSRELHIRIKCAFDRENIEIPYNYINVIERTTREDE
jgi:small conductance mechanosensitive channel